MPKTSVKQLFRVAAAVGVAAAATLVAQEGSASGMQVNCLGQPATIVGTSGDDRGATALLGTSGDDVIAGLSGDDVIIGRGGNDLICGGSGNDYIDAGAGDDTVRGQNGDDTIIGRSGANSLDGGNGTDVVSYAPSPAQATVDLRDPATGGYVGQQGSDTLTGFENIIGSAFGDNLTGDGLANLIDGAGGDDVLNGRGANDELLGGGGDDLLNGGGGDDVLVGGAGVDRANGGPGIDQCTEVAIERNCETVTVETLVEVPVGLLDHQIRGFGVADVDGDSFLDIYTANHYSAQSVLRGDGSGGFVDQVAAWGLDQDPEFPGLENELGAPTVGPVGMYAYFSDGNLYVQSVAGGPSISAGLTVLGNVSVVQDSGLVTGQSTVTLPTGLTETTFDLLITGDALLELDIFSVGAPVSLSLATPVDLNSVFIGHDLVNPETSDFDLYLRDRHAYGWSDLDGDGQLDAAIVRGGLHRQIGLYPIDIRDELLVFDGSRYADEAVVRDLQKGACPGSFVDWVDFDGDGLLDLFIVCQTPSVAQLHRQNPDGSFEEMAGALGLAVTTQGPIEWVDLDSDGDMDLLVPENDGLALYRNEPQAFVRELLLAEPIVPPSFGPAIGALAVFDFDVDGDLDVLMADDDGNRLLINTAGVFQLGAIETLGLPMTSDFAVWVDENNDGLPDLYSLPAGLYRQAPDGSFAATPILPSTPTNSNVGFDMASWFDMDNDGDRDLLVAARLFEHTGTSNHWLELDLTGPAGNREAIGAQVSVTTAAGTFLQEVGASEGALFSQGHYRLYYGLGTDASPLDLEIRWPDGSVEFVSSVAIDQLVELQHPAA